MSTSTNATTSDAQSPPPYEPDHSRRSQTPATMVGNPTTEEQEPGRESRDGDSTGTNVIYTPASTVSSSKESACDENTTERDGNNVWSEWWRAEALAAQVGSLSKELSQLKEMLSKQSFDDEASDLSRLKQNHRSSLASLAELHRTEMAGLAASHTESLRKLELQHMQELKDARRNHGHDRELIKGLHESYGRQIESLVLDLGEARREIRELELKQPLSVSTDLGVDPDLAEVSSRTLSIIMRFDHLKAPLDLADLTVPHPGPSFANVTRTVMFALQNHFRSLASAANYFLRRPKDEQVMTALAIRHWGQSVLSEAVTIRYILDSEQSATPMKDQWENGQWKNDGYVLRIHCSAEGWEGFYASHQDEQDDATVVGRSGGSESSPLEPLVPVVEDSSSSEAYNIAQLDRINRALGHLQSHQVLPSDPESEDVLHSEEDKENMEPRRSPGRGRKVTLEEVRDEDDPSRAPGIARGVTVPLVGSSNRATAEPSPPLIWEDEKPKKTKPKSRATDLGSLSEYLENEVRKSQLNAKGPKSSDDWLLDDIFSPLPPDKGKEKDTDGSFAKDITEEVLSKVPPSLVDPLIGNDKGDQWRWMLTSDGVVKTPPVGQGISHATSPHHTSNGLRNGIVTGSHKDVPAELQDVIEEGFVAPPPAPPAPRVNGQDSPTLPSYDQPDDIAIHPPSGSPAASSTGNPFADLKAEQCDTPGMDAAGSVVSSTPLLDNDATGDRLGHPLHDPRYSTGNHGAGRTPPFAPCPSSPDPKRSPPSKRGTMRRSTYFRSAGDSAKERRERWEHGSQGSLSTLEDWQSGNQYGRDPDYSESAGAFPWRREPRNHEYQSPRSISPPPSRSSTTTTDRIGGPEFILPPNTYSQSFGQNLNAGNNLGPFRLGMRPVGMAPLSAQPRVPAFPPGANFANQQHDLMVQQQMRRVEEMFNGLAQPVRANTAPSYLSGPVYAPNPPHSIAARNPSIGQMNSPFPNGEGPNPSIGNATRYPFDGWPVAGQNSQGLPSQIQRLRLNGSDPHCTFNGGSISPMLWTTNENVHSMGGQAAPQQGPSPSNSNTQPTNFPGILPPWAIGGPFAQPGTPSSQVGVHNGTHHRGSVPQGWFPPTQLSPLEMPWGGSPLQMGMPQWSGAYSA